MNTFYTIVAVLQVCAAIAVVGLVLVQHGKGADMGAAFGSGASGSLFGATGSSSFLSKATGFSAAIFFCATLGLAYLGNKRTAPADGVMDNLTLPVAPKSSEIPSSSATGASQPAVLEPKATAPAAGTTNESPAASAKNHADQIPK